MKITIEKRDGTWWVDCPCCANSIDFYRHDQAVIFADSHAWRAHRPTPMIILVAVRQQIDELTERVRHLTPVS